METVIKKSVGGTISFYHYADETAVTKDQLSSITAKVFQPGGGELVATASVTPAADGKMSVSISAANAGTVDSWYRAHFQYTYDSSTYTKDLYFHIAPTDFDIDFHNDDLLGFQSDLNNYDPSNNTKFYRCRDLALKEIYSRLAGAGYQPWKILNRSALEIPFGYLWMSYICRGVLRKSPGDMWDEAAQEYWEGYDERFKAANLIVADTDTANIADDVPRPIGRQKLVRG